MLVALQTMVDIAHIRCVTAISISSAYPRYRANGRSEV
jgi:hypothetical protein